MPENRNDKEAELNTLSRLFALNYLQMSQYEDGSKLDQHVAIHDKLLARLTILGIDLGHLPGAEGNNRGTRVRQRNAG